MLVSSLVLKDFEGKKGLILTGIKEMMLSGQDPA